MGNLSIPSHLSLDKFKVQSIGNQLSMQAPHMWHNFAIFIYENTIRGRHIKRIHQVPYLLWNLSVPRLSRRRDLEASRNASFAWRRIFSFSASFALSSKYFFFSSSSCIRLSSCSCFLSAVSILRRLTLHKGNIINKVKCVRTSQKHA